MGTALQVQRARAARQITDVKITGIGRKSSTILNRCNTNPSAADGDASSSLPENRVVGYHNRAGRTGAGSEIKRITNNQVGIAGQDEVRYHV